MNRGRVAAGLLAAVLASGPAVVAAQPVVSPDVRSEATRLFAELARIRGLPPPGPAPPIVVRTREERRRFVAQEIQRKYAPARVEAERRALVAWGLAPADFHLAGFLADLLAEQAAAYYDPVAKTMVLANWLTPELRAEALAHELVHALQDRQISLDRFLAGTPGRGDEALARQALIEGEAVALQLELRLRKEGRDLTTFPGLAAYQRAIVASATGPVLARAPRFLRAALTFPYAEGVGFVAEFRRRRPWARLSELYADPPRASAQILDPARYFDRREDPVAVPLPPLGDILGADARLVIEDELGAFGLTQVLHQFLDDRADAGGWAGDRYALWTAPAGAVVLIALTLWTDEPAAGVFADAYARLVGVKHGVGAPAVAGGVSAWRGGSLAVERRGRHVVLVEGAPPGALDALRDAVWRGRATSYRAPARLRSTIPASITVAPGQISRTR